MRANFIKDHAATNAARRAALRCGLAATRRLAGARQIFLTSYAAEPAPRWGWGAPPNTALHRLLEPGHERFALARKSIGAHLDFLSGIPFEGAPTSLHWNNGFWGALDAGFQCASLIDRAPARYVEVGSGFSTMFARRVIDAHGLTTTITSIDPHPRAEIDALCDDVVRSPLQDVDLKLFQSLHAGDIVLFDGSHETYMAADTVVMALEILPLLARGVLVGIDDVFLPWDYPEEWSDRFYGEQYLIGAYLLGAGTADDVVLPAFHLTRGDGGHHPFDDCVPNLGSFGKSLWIEHT